ncbi:MAG: protein kinase domain-containing protein [Planctomycetota bacterium]
MSEAEEKSNKRPGEEEDLPTASFNGTAGEQIGPFRIERELGRGAVGVVYLAHDTKLDRSVAIKSLPAEVMANPKARSRFTREARVLASLNHPNIATIYDEFQETEDVAYLILEYVPGQTLAERIAKKPLKLEEVLSIALQIAEAVAAAHEHDVIHRDLKPGNIKITPEGKVKVLDFGLAKAVGGEGLDQQSTVTEPGRVIGTPAYMSPEQARGKPTDKRSDIWSFGCVLYEMLTSRIPFKGETISDTLANILQTDPDWQALPESTPANIQVLLRRCLEKNPHRRLRDIGDASIEIDETLSSLTVSVATVGKMQPAGLRRLMVWGLVCLVLVAVAASLITWFLKPSPSLLMYPEESVQPPYYISFPVDVREIFRMSNFSIFDISPDGQRVVYMGFEGEDSPLYLWEKGKFGFRAIRGTEGAVSPFFSPDGKSVGFFGEGKLKVVALAGGPPRDLKVEAPNLRGASWGKDGILLAPTHTGGLILVPTEGQKLEPVTVAEPNHSREESSLRWPHLLPGGEAAIITIETADITSYDEAKLAWLDVRSGKYHYLQNIQGTYPRYHEASGHLVYASGGQILAVPLDLEKKMVVGRPIKIGDVLQSTPGSAQFDIAEDGTLIYIKTSPEFGKWKLVLKDRDGNTIRTTTDYYSFTNPSVSPDGDRIVVEVSAANDYLSICPLDSLNPTMLLKGWENSRPIWTPKGDYLTFSRNHEGTMNLYQIPVSNPSPSNIKRLTTQLSTKPRYPTSWSPDGNYLLFMQVDLESTGYDIYILSNENKEEKAIISTPDDEWDAMFSPDGKYIAYVSDREGRPEVFMRQFVSADISLGPPMRISTEGGFASTWSPDGNEIFFFNNNNIMWSVRLEFESGVYRDKAEPERLFEVDIYSARFDKIYRISEVTSDGQFIWWDLGEKDSLLDEIHVENFEKLLERRKQSGRDF